MKKLIIAAAIAALCATGAIADGDILSGKAAKKMLFSHRGSDFVIVPQDFMGEADVATLNLMAGMREFKTVLYYGAIAASPKRGLAHKATVASSNHHSVEAAGKAAINECNGLRGGGAKCVVVAHILPKKYSTQPQPLHLSASATAAFKKTYLRGGGPKAMAISPDMGSYAVSKGEGAQDAALAACSADGAKGCRIVFQD
ncbi:5-aminolevulic acid synthase [Profundibacter sp.]